MIFKQLDNLNIAGLEECHIGTFSHYLANQVTKDQPLIILHTYERITNQTIKNNTLLPNRPSSST